MNVTIKFSRLPKAIQNFTLLDVDCNGNLVKKTLRRPDRFYSDSDNATWDITIIRPLSNTEQKMFFSMRDEMIVAKPEIITVTPFIEKCNRKFIHPYMAHVSGLFSPSDLASMNRYLNQRQASLLDIYGDQIEDFQREFLHRCEILKDIAIATLNMDGNRISDLANTINEYKARVEKKAEIKAMMEKLKAELAFLTLAHIEIEVQ